MKFTKRILTTAFCLAIAGTTLKATGQTADSTAAATAPATQTRQIREDFSDASLKKFIEINKKLEPHQKSAEDQMVKAIQQEGLTPDRFSQILAAQQQSDTTNAGANSAELGKFNNAAKKIMTIQSNTIPQMEKVITGAGMKTTEFQEIVIAYNQSPKVRKRIDAMLQPSPGAKQ